MRQEGKESVRKRYELLQPHLEERGRRLWAATEALAFGVGGVRAVAEALQMSTNTILQGKRELQAEPIHSDRSGGGGGRQRRPGGGRKPVLEKQPGLLPALEQIVDPSTRGDPMAPLKWVSKSLPHIVSELSRRGYAISSTTVSKLLQEELGYSLQALQKTREGASHPDRDAQFQYINRQCQAFQQRHQPVISIDSKKKELVGDFKNGGREWHRQGEPEPVRTHDFEDKQKGKATPHGVYDIGRNQGWVTVGIDHDTAEFAVDSLRLWWKRMGQPTYPEAKELLITADAGGSNSYRARLWKCQLQKFADETGLSITVCHFPPGTSKWNRIEHRMFCHITANWRGRPLETLEVIVNLIANTQTSKGLTIQADLNVNSYRKGIKVSEEEMSRLNIARADFHGEWNYSVLPRISTA
ncbi:MAG TPA: ISAzo13 family transposase [Candidatus Acidoferrales bacterium]|nr:ISAzo13 family transposase [Candidatus Acidoferrales bacterium]